MAATFVLPVKNNMKSYSISITSDIPIEKFQVDNRYRINILDIYYQMLVVNLKYCN